MNLENLNLVELNAQEVVEIDGGLAPIVWGIILLICLLSSQKAY